MNYVKQYAMINSCHNTALIFISNTIYQPVIVNLWFQYVIKVMNYIFSRKVINKKISYSRNHQDTLLASPISIFCIYTKSKVHILCNLPCKARLLMLMFVCLFIFPIVEYITPNILTALNVGGIQVIVKERHETLMGYKPRERVALEWFIPIIAELLVP